MLVKFTKPPPLFYCHWYVKPRPVAVTLNEGLPFGHADVLAGCIVIAGLAFTVSIADALVTAGLQVPGI